MSNKWHPIETSPKNGDDFIVYSDASNVYGLAYWNVPFNREPNLVCTDSTGDWFRPTHWMPLPEPPR